MSTITTIPAYKLVTLMQQGELSAVEVTKAFLTQIDQVNPSLNAVIQLDEVRALAQAQRADDAIAADQSLGPLHGLPITIKDTIDILGFDNTYGSHLYDDYEPQQEGTCVTRLREAGATILGLTNAPELLTAYESDNLIYGATNNPYDVSRSAGGSSGGEAAIIAAHGSPFGLGTDGGGSIRLPAHYCGIVGIKPTQGLIPVTGINLPFSGPGCLQAFGTCGPMANRVADVRLGLHVMMGADGVDPNAPPVSLPQYRDIDFSQLKVAYFTDNGIVSPTQDIQNAVRDAAILLGDLGANVSEARPVNIERTFELHWEPFFTQCDGGISVLAPFASLAQEQISPLRRQFNRDAMACKFTTAEMNQRFAEIAAFKWSTLQFLNDYDVLICPPCATTAKPHGECLNAVKDFTYTMSFNNSGSPAVVLPFTRSTSSLPIGIQIVTNLWRDEMALAVAEAIESQLGQSHIGIEQAQIQSA
jgi:amidase